jgi:hypothetical protein
MSGWQALARELDRWQAAGRRASFWWRDDDATAGSPALDRLLALADRHALPLTLAVIPAGAEAGLAARLDGQKRLSVLQHGYAHANHAPEGEKKMELGTHRPMPAVLDELRRGRRQLRRRFGRRFVPALVPPWNRIDPAVLSRLRRLGFAGLSSFGERAGIEAAPGIRQVNCHIEVMNWRTRRFIGDEPALEFARGHLARRREGATDAREPTGLMTHHLAHDAAAWRFLERFLTATARHPAARWLSARQIFPMRVAGR